MPTTGDGDLIEAISDHVENHIGPIEVFHEIVSDLVHLDVLWAKPNKRVPFHTLVTCGMSELPMIVPDDHPFPPYLELCAFLPSTWPMQQVVDHMTNARRLSEAEMERGYWPIRMLKDLAKLPHEHRTFLGQGHTVGNDDPKTPYASDTKLCAAYITFPYQAGFAFTDLRAGHRTIRFLQAVPMFAEELGMKLSLGSDALEDAWDNAGIFYDLFNPTRVNVANGSKSTASRLRQFAHKISRRFGRAR